MTTNDPSMDRHQAEAGGLSPLASAPRLDPIRDALDTLNRALQGDSGLTMTAKPTVAELLPALEQRLSAPTYLVYRPGLRRLAAEHPATPIDRFTTDDLELVMLKVIAAASKRVLATAERTGKPLRSYEPGSHGRSAGENALRGFAALFTMAERQGLIYSNPVRHKLKAPSRLDAPERPLTSVELAELHAVWSATGDDPQLDGLLFEFHRKTAARRIGALNLRLSNLHPDLGTVVVTEKFSKTRTLPLDVDLLRRLNAFALSRGAVGPSGHVFRSKRHTPMTRKRYETIYRRHHAQTSWTRELEVGVHWLRHTTLDDILNVANERVAAEFAGHAPSSIGPIGLYTKAPLARLQAVYEQLFGPIFNTSPNPVTARLSPSAGAADPLGCVTDPEEVT